MVEAAGFSELFCFTTSIISKNIIAFKKPLFTPPPTGFKEENGKS